MTKRIIRPYKARSTRKAFILFILILVIMNGTKEVQNKQGAVKVALRIQEPLEKLIIELRDLIKTYKVPWQLSHIITKIMAGDEKHRVKLLDELIFAASAVRTLPNLAYDSDLQNLGTYLDEEFNCLESIRRLLIELAQSSNENEIAAVKDDIVDLCDETKRLISKVKAVSAKVSATF